MVSITSIGVSVPATSSGSLSRQILETPILLAEFGVSIPASPNRVLLNATIGITATSITPTLLVNFRRGNQIISSNRVTIQTNIGEEEIISLQTIDVNALLSSNQGYSITIQVEGSLLNAAVVSGPVNFSGVVYSLS